MNLSQENLIHFALLDAQLRNVDLEMQSIQARVVALAAERAETEAERIALYTEVGLDTKKHLVIANKKAFDKATGAPLAYGRIYDLATGKEYVKPLDTSEPTT